ncbi:hypothetical protein IAU60_004264 [Kwoniella sp. DSM 27419]
MSHLFSPDRALLLPQFETYRLKSLDPDHDISTHKLPGSGATQSRVGFSSQHLSFKEVRARIGWDHLAVGSGGRGIYVDKDWAIMGFTITQDLRPVFTRLAELPTPVSSHEQQAEFPSVLSLTPTYWAISTGSGSLYILRTSDESGAEFSASLVARYDLVAESGDASPFLLRSAHLASSQEARLLVTRSVRPVHGERNMVAAQQTTFELLELCVDFAKTNEVDDGPIEQLQVTWRLQGGDLPVWTGWNGDGWLVLSAEEFAMRQAHVQEETLEQKEKREREEKVAKLGLGASLGPMADRDDQMTIDEPDHAQPYNWTQDAESLSIRVPLPSGVARADLQVQLSPTGLSLALSPDSIPSPALAAFLTKPDRSWWTSIDVTTSSWTFDPAKCMLELDLAKEDENTRWPSVFAPADDDDEDDYAEVPETLSSATLAAVRETFNHIKTRGPDEPDTHPAMAALLREEMDFDLDDGEDYGDGQDGMYSELGGGGKVGREVLVGSVKDGIPTWSKATTSILSMPMSGTSGNGIIVKNAVDGLLFEPGVEPARQAWEHTSINPALAFVMSSKRDLRLVRHLTMDASLHPHEGAELSSPSSSKRNKTSESASKHTTVFAFDSGSSSAGQGNLYVYYPAESATGALQGVIPVSGGERGALLGVGAVRVNNRNVVVALCENELVVLKGVL